MDERICYFFSFLIEGIVFWNYVSILFVPKCSAKIRFVCLSFGFFILFLFSLHNIFLLNCILYTTVCFLYLIFLYKTSWYALFHSLLFEVLTGACELPVYSFLSTFFTSANLRAADFHLKLLFAVISKTLFFAVMSVLLLWLKKRQKPFLQYDKSVFFTILIPFIAQIIVLILIAVCDSTAMTATQNRLITTSAFFLLIVNLLIFGLNQYNQKKHLEFTEMQLQLQKEHDSAEYYKMLIAQNENQRILIHDMKKHFQTLKLMNEYGEVDKVNKYLDNLLEDSDVKSVEDISNNTFLGAILYRYTLKAKEKNIRMNCDIRDKCIEGIDEMTITTILYNLLDNAIENCGGESPFINISIQKKNDSYVNINILNRSIKKPVQNKYGDFISDKPDKTMHGLGLKSIKSTIKKNGGEFSAYYSPEDKVFHAVVILYVEK